MSEQSVSSLLELFNGIVEHSGRRNESRNESCWLEEPQAYVNVRFWFVTVLGSAVSLLGAWNNLTLLYLFLFRLQFASSYMFYLVFLAFFDLLVGCAYMLMFSVAVAFDHLHSYWMYRLWHSYVRLVATTAQISITASTYLIVAASAERYFTMAQAKVISFGVPDRCRLTAIVLLFAAASKGSVYFELVVTYQPECAPFGRYHLSQSELARDPMYDKLVRFWYRNVFHVFLPFLSLLYLNGAVMWSVRQSLLQRQEALVSVALAVSGQLAQRKATLRSATRMLAAIVATYLLTNLPNVLVTIWEHVEERSLHAYMEGVFFQFASDTSSFLTVASGASRLPIYYVCNKQLRDEIRRLFRQTAYYKRRRSMMENRLLNNESSALASPNLIESVL